MLQSKLFAKIKKENPREAETVNHKYLVRADFISQSLAGAYRFLPLGKLVLEKIKEVVRQEMLGLGAQEVELTALQNKSLWLETGRWSKIDPPLFKFKDRRGKELALGSTHEEDITDIFRSNTQMPLSLFQIQTKFRNEMRPTGGLLRTREFLMKDLYSFHGDKKDFGQFYEKVKKSYFRIFKKCGLEAVCVPADPGTIGGDFSHEFMVVSPAGEDKVKGKNAIEVGHIFCLGQKYIKAMKVQKSVIMGCYGVGISRLMGTIVEENHDDKGIIWPAAVAPFQVHLIPISSGAKAERRLRRERSSLRIENNQKVRKASEKLYSELQKSGVEVLYDDRAGKTPGEKFAEADLIGVPLRIVVSEKTLAKNSVELKRRAERKVQLVKLNQIKRYV